MDISSTNQGRLKSGERAPRPRSRAILEVDDTKPASPSAKPERNKKSATKATTAVKPKSAAPPPSARNAAHSKKANISARKAASPKPKTAPKAPGKQAATKPLQRQATSAYIESAKRTLQLETEGLADLCNALSGPMADAFDEAVAMMHNAKGRVIVSGIGKSGHIGQKIAATFASTGTAAFFVHPSEASHGDLGMISADDVVLAISWSGETFELGNILNHSRRFAVPLIAITSRTGSTLAKAADVVLTLPKAPEACPHGLAPTTSTTMTLALGDCLAMALLEARGFTAEDFKRIHPGGSLGAQLRFVEDIMHDATDLPLVGRNTPMTEAIVTMTQKAFGCLGVTDNRGRLIGVITDGDLRRHMGADLLSLTTDRIMTKKPKTVRPDLLASAALEQLNASRITALFVVEKSKPVGIIHIHDLLRSGLG